MAEREADVLDVVLGIDPVARCARKAKCAYCCAPLGGKPGVKLHLASDEADRDEEVTLACESCAWAFLDAATKVLKAMLGLMKFEEAEGAEEGDKDGPGKRGKVVRLST